MARKPVNHYKAFDSIQRLADNPIWLISSDMSFKLLRRQIFISIHEKFERDSCMTTPFTSHKSFSIFMCQLMGEEKSQNLNCKAHFSAVIAFLPCRYCGRQQSWNSQSLKSYHTQCYNHSLIKLFIIFSVCKQRFFFLLLCFFSSQKR